MAWKFLVLFIAYGLRSVLWGDGWMVEAVVNMSLQALWSFCYSNSEALSVPVTPSLHLCEHSRLTGVSVLAHIIHHHSVPVKDQTVAASRGMSAGGGSGLAVFISALLHGMTSLKQKHIFVFRLLHLSDDWVAAVILRPDQWFSLSLENWPPRSARFLMTLLFCESEIWPKSCLYLSHSLKQYRSVAFLSSQVAGSKLITINRQRLAVPFSVNYSSNTKIQFLTLLVYCFSS